MSRKKRRVIKERDEVPKNGKKSLFMIEKLRAARKVEK